MDCSSVLVACEGGDDKDGVMQEDSAHINWFEVKQVQLVQPTPLGTSLRSGIQSIKGILPFGVNDLHIIGQRRIQRIENGVPNTVLQTLHSHQRILVTSSLFRYAAALNKMQDRLYFGWGGNWTKELEQATADLVMHTNSDVTNAMQLVVDTSRRNVVFTEIADEIQDLLDQLIKRVQDAGSKRSLQAISQLHDTLSFFMLFSDAQLLKMRVPEAFVNAFRSFLHAKMNALDKAVLVDDLRILVSFIRFPFADKYV